MVTETLKTLTKRILSEDTVALEIKAEDNFPVRYTVSLGPQGNKNNTRMEFSQSNFDILANMVRIVKGWTVNE